MPKRSNDFQKLVLLLNHVLEGRARVTESAMLTDQVTGNEREVDILITTKTHANPILVGVEVTDRKRRVDVTWIEQLWAKHTHLPTDKLIVVSRSGFSRAAKVKAVALAVHPATYEETERADWPFAMSLLAGGSFEVVSFDFTCDMVLEYQGAQTVYENVDRGHVVYLPYRDEPTTIEQMARYFIEMPELRDVLAQASPADGTPAEYAAAYRPPPGCVVRDEHGSELALVRLTVRMIHKRVHAPINFVTGACLGEDFGFGASTVPNRPFHFLFVRDSSGRVSGSLLDPTGVRTLGPPQRPAR